MPIETPFTQMSWMLCQLYFLLGLAIGGATWLFEQKYMAAKSELYKYEFFTDGMRQGKQVIFYI